MAYKKLKLWFDKELAQMLVDKIKVVRSDLEFKKFIKQVDSQVDELELKDRVEVIADGLYILFGEDYEQAIDILLKILGPENEEETGMFVNFYWVMPIAKVVEKYGLSYFELSMRAIEEVTKRNTGEYTIRPYLEADTKKTLDQMKKWAASDNKHVRRLASEGGRPRLPWASKLDIFIANPKQLFPILNKLKDDPSKYVQKSVANCINDILKDNYTLGQNLINKWNVKNLSKERKWIIKHALRNLIKSEDKWALEVIGSQ